MNQYQQTILEMAECMQEMLWIIKCGGSDHERNFITKECERILAVNGFSAEKEAE